MNVTFTIEVLGVTPTSEKFYVPSWLLDQTTYLGGKLPEGSRAWDSPNKWAFGSQRGEGYDDVPDTGFIRVNEYEGYVNGEWSGKQTGKHWDGDVQTVSNQAALVFVVPTENSESDSGEIVTTPKDNRNLVEQFLARFGVVLPSLPSPLVFIKGGSLRAKRIRVSQKGTPI